MEIVNFLKSFAENNGAASVIVLILTVIITNLIKIPIKKHAAKIAAIAKKSGFNVTESYITSIVVYIPFGVALALFCGYDAVMTAFGHEFNFVEIMAKTPIIAAASIGLYSLVTNTIDKAAQKAEYKAFVKSAATQTTDTVLTDAAVTVTAEQPAPAATQTYAPVVSATSVAPKPPVAATPAAVSAAPITNQNQYYEEDE